MVQVHLVLPLKLKIIINNQQGEIKEIMNNKNSEKKYQQAQSWWDSLSKKEKQSELKKIEAEWIKKRGGNDFHGFVEGRGSLVEFKDGCLRCSPSDLSLVPVVFLERFGIKVYPRFSFSDFGKDFPGYDEDLQRGKREIRQIDKERKDNHFSSQPQNIVCWPWIIGISVISLVILGFLIFTARKHKKTKK